MAVKKISSAKEITNSELRKEMLDFYAVVSQEPGPDHPHIKRLKKRGLPKGDGLVILPPDKTIRIDETIRAPQSMRLPSAVVDHFIKIASHRVIANFCICRDARDCRNYPIDFGCIFLGDSAKDISPDLGRAVGVEEALQYAAKCREAGLIQTIGRYSADQDWLNDDVGPINKLMTICNCCLCHCELFIMRPFISEDEAPMLTRMPGVEIRVSQDCTGCGACEGACPYDAIRLQGERAEIDGQKCIECGKCTNVCPVNAIQINISDENYIQQTIESLSKRVDVQ